MMRRRVMKHATTISSYHCSRQHNHQYIPLSFIGVVGGKKKKKQQQRQQQQGQRQQQQQQQRLLLQGLSSSNINSVHIMKHEQKLFSTIKSAAPPPKTQQQQQHQHQQQQQQPIKELPPGFLNEISQLNTSYDHNNDDDDDDDDDGDEEERRRRRTTVVVEIDVNRYELERHSHGESYHRTNQLPLAIIKPYNTEATSKVVQICARYKVPIIPFGVGTSVEGHVLALHGGISLDTSKLDSIEYPNYDDNDNNNNGNNNNNNDNNTGENLVLEDFHVTVGAGVTRLRLNEELRHTGLAFMVDPGADATIGGMVACGASGTTAVKYGTMRENTLALEVVLPNGQINHYGSLATKNSAGYDLRSLFIGSEGTLGIITKVTLKLHPIPSFVASTICSFPTLHNAADAVYSLISMGVDLTRCELLDKKSVFAFNQYTTSTTSTSTSSSSSSSSSSCSKDEKKTTTLPVTPHLFLEFTGASKTSMMEQANIAKSICVNDHYGSNFEIETNETKRRLLWSARHSLYYACLALRKGSSYAFATDACVPLSKFADLLQSTSDDVDELNIVATCFGHAGDGNFHCIMPLLPPHTSNGDGDDDDDNDGNHNHNHGGDTDEYLERVYEVNDRLIQRTIKVGGTCTGEHGVGCGKVKYLSLQYGEGTVRTMHMIKSALDPLNLMNPGKIISSSSSSSSYSYSTSLPVKEK